MKVSFIFERLTLTELLSSDILDEILSSVEVRSLLLSVWFTNSSDRIWSLCDVDLRLESSLLSTFMISYMRLFTESAFEKDLECRSLNPEISIVNLERSDSRARISSDNASLRLSSVFMRPLVSDTFFSEVDIAFFMEADCFSM